MQCSTVQFITEHYSTAQYSSVKYDMVQYSRTEKCIVQFRIIKKSIFVIDILNDTSDILKHFFMIKAVSIKI